LKCTEKCNSNCRIEIILTEDEETKMNFETYGCYLLGNYFFLNEFHRTLMLCMKDKRKCLFLSVLKNWARCTICMLYNFWYIILLFALFCVCVPMILRVRTYDIVCACMW